MTVVRTAAMRTNVIEQAGSKYLSGIGVYLHAPDSFPRLNLKNILCSVITEHECAADDITWTGGQGMRRGLFDAERSNWRHTLGRLPRPEGCQKQDCSVQHHRPKSVADEGATTTPISGIYSSRNVLTGSTCAAR